jgi:hypothetical protein
MGYILTTEPCPSCGYDAGDFAVGIGLFDEVRTDVALCAVCLRFVSVTCEDEPCPCPTCGSAVIRLPQVVTNPDTSLPCPKCADGRIQFLLAGLWD